MLVYNCASMPRSWLSSWTRKWTTTRRRSTYGQVC